MLKELQKALGIKPKAEAAPAASTETLEAVVEATAPSELDALRAEFDSFKQTAEELAAHEQEVIAALSAELDGVKAALVEAQAALAAATAGKAQAEADALAQKLAARKEKVVAAIGTERADALLSVTEGMDDAQFDAVLSALGASAAVEAASPLFKEVGVDAQADAAQVVESESKEMKILREKYGKK